MSLTPSLLVAFVLFVSPALAQTFHGSIRGRVADLAAPVGGAQVELIEVSTGVASVITTNSGGDYQFPALPPGSYRVRVSAAGYKQTASDPMTVGPRSAVTFDIRLDAGAVSEYVTVTAPALPDRVNGPLGMPFSHADLIAQPTAGRNIFIMAALAPTVVPTGNAIFVRQQDQSNASLLSMTGSARRANSYVIDGVPIVDIQNRATIIPGMEAVEEMRVQLGPTDAEAGRTSGGVFNVAARAGTNRWRGSTVYQNRPDGAQAQLFFAERAKLPRVDTSYHLFAGSLGGPIVRNRTFFFLSGEGYRTESSRNTVLRLPTAAERRGDFSQSRFTIFDPLTTRPDPAAPGRFLRDPFPNNQIPVSRLNPVAVAMLGHVPSAAGGTSVPVNAGVVDEAKQITGKLTHRWGDRLTASAMYAWYRSAEPDARFFGGGLFANGADPGDGALVRRVHFLALNPSWAFSDHSLLQVRYGLNQFLDDNRGADFDPGTLAFDPEFVSSVPFKKFPSIAVNDYGQGGALLGDRDRQRGVFYAHNASAVFTTLKGRHSLRAGGEYRVTGVDFTNLGGSGYFGFSRDFTNGPDPIAGAAGSGDAMASFLLGYPAHGGISTSSPINAFVRYGAVFLQDDIRAGSRLTLTVGLRHEFEDGLREANDRMAVGWASDTSFPIQVAGVRPDGTPLQLTGGLIYAGVSGAPTVQGRAARWQPSPRLGAAFSVNEATVVRGNYGVFRAPQQGISASEIGTGTRGYNVTTNMVTTLDNRFIPCDTCTLTNPFPHGIAQPSGNALGVMTGVGGGVEFVDPDSAPGYYHRYSFEVSRQIGARLTAHTTYAGAIGRNLAIGGSSGSFLGINQLDPKHLALGAGLLQPVPNPFYGTPLAVGILAGATIPAGQLLRPYPQFDSVFALRSGLARSRYDALIVGADLRFNRGSLRANYTFSQHQDSQYGESNFFSEGSSVRNYYDLDAEYGLSALDTPHRLNLSGSANLPFGLSLNVAATYQSGFPVFVNQAAQNTGLLGGSQRPNIVTGVTPVLTGDPVDAFDAACSCIRWLNPAAWSEAPPFTIGTAPRADGRIRTPGRRLLDVALDRALRLPTGALTLRAEVINLLNASDFRGPNGSFGSATFGEIRSDAGFPRTLQLRARFAW